MMETETCPHCGRQVPAEQIADDFSGCPLAEKCEGKGLQPEDAWPGEEES